VPPVARLWSWDTEGDDPNADPANGIGDPKVKEEDGEMMQVDDPLGKVKNRRKGKWEPRHVACFGD
jgi:hypothetical protein